LTPWKLPVLCVRVFVVSTALMYFQDSGILKSVSAIVIFQECPEVKKHLGRDEFGKDGYFADTIGDMVAAEVIRKYIQYHRIKKRFQPS